MKKCSIIIIVILFLSTITYSQSKIIINTNFDDVKIFKMTGQDKIEPAVGIGSAQVKLSKKNINRFLFEKEGSKTEIKEFPRTQKCQKRYKLI